MSSRILNPWPESERIASVKASRSIMKNPLIGSVRSALTTSRPSRLAKSLITTRECCQSPTLPSPTWRLATTISSRSALILASISGSSVSSCCRSPSMTAT